MDTKIIENKESWEEFISGHPEANFLQSWYWGEFQESLGRKIFRIGFFKQNKLEGVMFCYIETSKRGRFLVVPGGPIIDWGNKALTEKFVSELKRIGIENRCVFVRVRPQLTDDDFSRKTFANLGFKKAPMYLHAELTSQLSIEKNEDEIISQMRKATRYEIKKAKSLGIELIINGNSNIENFYKLQIETAKRQKFVPFSENFLLKQFELFIKNDKAILYTTRYKNKILAQAFIIFYGQEAVYHYGASTDEGRKYPGAYLIQWEAILEAKRRGMLRYNFWGISPEGSKDHRFSGLSLFKRGFGGQDVSYLPAQDLIIDKNRYVVNFLIEKIRRAVRRS